jgi:hypothetical protein
MVRKNRSIINRRGRELGTTLYLEVSLTYILESSRFSLSLCSSIANIFIFCSPKDQAILEAEFAQDPKPNKAARAVIVEKVDMNEKEVQVSSP